MSVPAAPLLSRGLSLIPVLLLPASTTPVFVQVQKHWRQLYVGMCHGAGLRTNYNMVHLHYTPPQCNHLSGLVTVFRSKLVGE